MSWDWEKLKNQQQHQRPGGGGPGNLPPQMDDLLNQFKNIKIPGGPLIAILVILLLFFGYSVFFTIESGSVGVVQRFGKFIRIAQPGPNFKLPFGVEKVTKVRQDRIYKEEFGFRSTREDSRSRYGGGADTASASLMLTGDLNVAVVPWIVQYRIKEPYNFLFKVQNVRKLLIDLSEASMRLVVGDRSINEVISKRQEIATYSIEVLQKELDKAETGIKVVTIEMKKTNVPEPVQPSFNEVNQAIQEKERMVYQAREQYNKVIPVAKGTAEKTVKEAEGYSLDRVNRAKGDASRFLSLYAEYSKAEDVTRRRLYLEAMQEIFPSMGNKYIVDADQKNFLPLLNLGKSEGGK